MTQAAVNNAIVLHRLSVSREDVRRADELYSKTSELQKILTNPEIPLAKDVYKRQYQGWIFID